MPTPYSKIGLTVMQCTRWGTEDPAFHTEGDPQVFRWHTQSWTRVIVPPSGYRTARGNGALPARSYLDTWPPVILPGSLALQNTIRRPLSVRYWAHELGDLGVMAILVHLREAITGFDSQQVVPASTRGT